MRIGRCGVITERARCVVFVSFGKQNDLRTVTKRDVGETTCFLDDHESPYWDRKKPLHIGFRRTVEFC